MPSPQFAPHGRPQHSTFATILGNPQPNVPTARSERISRGRGNSQSCPHFSFRREENKTPKKPQPPPSAMAKSRDVNKEAVIRRLRARLDRRSRGADAEADAPLRAQVDFYVRLRAALFANSGSTNMDAVDAVAVAVLADDTLFPVELLETETLPPLPDSLHVVAAPPHDLFTVPAPQTRSSGKRPTTRSASKPPPSKMQRKSRAQYQDEDDADDADDEEGAPEGDGAEEYEFPLPAKCPATIRRDISKIIKQAGTQGKTPPRMAYPWTGQRVWHDPQEHPALHVAHWRFWMHWRDVFFACALYAPSDECNARRKKKSNVGQARLAFISLNIVELGFYDFLDDGYQSISDLLEQTDALNPTKPAHLRLSDEALARVVIDITGGSPPNPSWVGNKSAGTRKVLLGDARIRALAKKLKPLRDNYSDFEDDEDMFTVLPPTPDLDEEDDGEPDELDEHLPETEADQDQDDDEEQDDHEVDEDRSSGANDPTDDDKKSSVGDEGDDTSSKKSAAPPASPKSK
ncbi:hypothetical protein PHYSODRAFT_338496 [Phytophthora sojae]|uniref:Uncharacterized protein n=1 Tax=Phytophthora sojae (strain P6497) TaxID=1094619 RepID=G5A507_PHYSP|nr:hypothetical protein PHYSODRAFT_338496 [Phytophthora sojae]EGZ09756.1 hypothetical protein PHYSODRAFT_338496 [Phytophthora sojae]|eukprot:XP_009534617.1 hypothetical protein PHYSODRAFT_338496 [Phytophthora sojae]